MRAVALRQPLELGGDAQDGLAWFEGGCQPAAELGSARQDLLAGSGTRQQRHLTRQAVERDWIQAERGADAAHRLACTQADVDAEPKCAERRQTRWECADGTQALGP